MSILTWLLLWTSQKTIHRWSFMSVIRLVLADILFLVCMMIMHSHSLLSSEQLSCCGYWRSLWSLVTRSYFRLFSDFVGDSLLGRPQESWFRLDRVLNQPGYELFVELIIDLLGTSSDHAYRSLTITTYSAKCLCECSLAFQSFVEDFGQACRRCAEVTSNHDQSVCYNEHWKVCRGQPCVASTQAIRISILGHHHCTRDGVDDDFSGGIRSEDQDGHVFGKKI